MSASLVGSEMCIRDRGGTVGLHMFSKCYSNQQHTHSPPLRALDEAEPACLLELHEESIAFLFEAGLGELVVHERFLRVGVPNEPVLK
eukprot:11386044-Alexandrium_andersonii.AAC.1